MARYRNVSTSFWEDNKVVDDFINSPDYWKGGVYSAANVQALIIKWAASL